MGVQRKIKKAVSNSAIAVSQAFEEFIAEKEAKNLAPSSLRNYRQSYNYFMEFNSFTEETTADEITSNHFFHWIGNMKLEGVKPTSINHYLRDCRTFFYWCMATDREYIKPAFKIEMIKGQEEPLKMFTDEDIENLLIKPRINDSFATWRTWAIVNWVLGTGNRAATICDVQVGDIDFKAKEIALRHTKSKKAQIIPLSSSLGTVLKEYMRIWRQDVEGEAWLFPNVGEEQLTTNALRHSFSKYCHDREADRTNIHGLRHNFARAWIRNGGGLVQLQRILGHSTLDMTRRYVNLFADDIKEDFDDFSPLDNIKKAAKRTHAIKRAK